MEIKEISAQVITSKENLKVKAARALKRQRIQREEGLTLLEGLRLVEDAVAAGVRLVRVFFTPRFAVGERGEALLEKLRAQAVELLPVSEPVLHYLADTQQPQGILAVAVRPRGGETVLARPAEGAALVLALAGVQDPGNLGTIIRTAAAFGVTGLLLGTGTVDPFNPKALRATMGAIFRVPLRDGVDLATELPALRRAGWQVVLSNLQPQGLPPARVNWQRPTVLVMGGEARGVPPQLLREAEVQVRIPMQAQVESLNVAVATAILLYEAGKQRRLL